MIKQLTEWLSHSLNPESLDAEGVLSLSLSLFFFIYFY